MDVGDKQSAKAPFGTLLTHGEIPMREQITESRDSVMTHRAPGERAFRGARRANSPQAPDF
jgi:hypothetical protein